MITSEIVVAYSQCKLKAYLLLCTDQEGIEHEYTSILKEKSKKNEERYLNNLKLKFPEATPYSLEKIKQGIPILVEAGLTFEELKGYAVTLTKDEKKSSRSKNNYTPAIAVETRKISKEQKIQLAFVAYILSKLQKEKPVSGIIIGCDSKVKTIKLELFYKEICLALKHIKTWIKKSKSELPDLYINKHCQDCSFQKDCEIKAIEKDDLSLLRRMSSKDIQKYHKKGIFTITQLSYLFKPRKQRKGKNKTKIPLYYRPELQALAIRTEKIYIQELPILVEHKIELFLDIEGTPDEGSYYLIGLLIYDGDKQLFYSFWADSIKEERMGWVY